MASYSAWIETRLWCLANPEKRAVIVTPQGVFEIRFLPQDLLQGVDSSVEKFTIEEKER